MTPPGINSRCPSSVLGSQLPLCAASFQHASCSIRSELKIIVIIILHIFLRNFSHVRISCLTRNILLVPLFAGIDILDRGWLLHLAFFLFVLFNILSSVQSNYILLLSTVCTHFTKIKCNLPFQITCNVATIYILPAEKHHFAHFIVVKGKRNEIQKWPSLVPAITAQNLSPV